MGKQVRQPGEVVRDLLLRMLAEHPNDIVTAAANQLGCSRQAVHRHLKRLVEQGAVVRNGSSRKPEYSLAPLSSATWNLKLTPNSSESDIWDELLHPLLGSLPKNVLGIWQYAFTEMVNNAIDHSGGKNLFIRLNSTAISTSIEIMDDGIGIFRKIQGELDLVDERQALFELSKGKLTTDPANHTGQGIFFSSRMMDEFCIISGGLIFDHQRKRERDFLGERDNADSGTWINMVLNNHTSRSTKKVFDEYSSTDGDYRFNKTVVPVTLAKFGPSELVSRSQAKRLLSRVDLFEVVIFDFKGVETIGQAFADEIFRVYARAHTTIELRYVNCTEQVAEMIARAKSERVTTPGS